MPAGPGMAAAQLSDSDFVNSMGVVSGTMDRASDLSLIPADGRKPGTGCGPAQAPPQGRPIGESLCFCQCHIVITPLSHWLCLPSLQCPWPSSLPCWAPLLTDSYTFKPLGCCPLPCGPPTPIPSGESSFSAIISTTRATPARRC